MNFGQAAVSGFRNYVNFSTRAARSEFWYWALFNFLISLVTAFVDIAVFGVDADIYSINSLASLVLLLPSLAVAVRRLHDIDRTGWWVLIAFTGIGILVLIYWDCVRGTSGPNRFGPDPLAGQA